MVTKTGWQKTLFSRIQQGLRWLDLRSPGWSLAVGLVVGAGLGAVTLGFAEGWLGLGLSLAWLGLAVALGVGGKPILSTPEITAPSSAQAPMHQQRFRETSEVSETERK